MEEFYIHDLYREIFHREKIASLETLHEFSKIGEIVSSSSTLALRRRPLEDFHVYAKTYEYSPASWRYFLRHSRGYKEFSSLQFFHSVKIPCPEVLCFGEKRVFGRLAWSTLVLREVVDSYNLVEVFSAISSEHPLRSQILQEIAKHAALMHQNKFFYSTLRFRNILWQKNKDNIPLIYFIDLPLGRCKLFFSSKNFLFDLASLYKDMRVLCSSEERESLLGAYSVHFSYPTKKLLQQVPTLCEKIFGPISKQRPYSTETKPLRSPFN